MDTLIAFGSAVKALGDGRVAGYLIRFSDEASPDLTGDFFTHATDFDIEDGDRKSVYFSHGLDPQLKTRRIGKATVKTDEVGVWIEAQLSLRDEYEKAIYGLVEQKKIGWSSGAPAHLVTRRAVETKDGSKVHEILSWNLAEASLTPCPAEPRNGAVAMKSLPALLGLHPANHTKALPSGMSYDDLRSLLQDELNEDFPDDDDDPDTWTPGLVIRDVYDDAVVYADEEDLFRRTYQVTAGNDIVWGPEESVVRVTTYVTATDVDEAGEDDATTMTGTKQAETRTDTTALKVMLRGSMTFSDHADIAQDAIEGFVERVTGLLDLSTKAGRVISASNRKKIKEMHAGMQLAHAAMGTHIATMQALLNETEPAAKTAAIEQAHMRFLAHQAEALGVELRA